MKKKVLDNKRFGRLLVLGENGRTKWGGLQYKCLCDCGNTTIVSSQNLIRGHTKSCGCHSPDNC